MDAHPAAELFPLMGDDELDALAEDIRAHGQREPITTYRGRILDGRNRWRACERLSLLPAMREWDGQGSPTAFVISMNLQRRHLEKGQRAMIAAEALPLFEAEAKERQREGQQRGGQVAGRSRPKVVAADAEATAAPAPDSIMAKTPPSNQPARKDAADAFGVGERYVSDAKRVQQKAPDLAEQVKAGVMKLPEAVKAVAREEAAEVAALVQGAIDADPVAAARVHQAEVRQRWSTVVRIVRERLLTLDTPEVVASLDRGDVDSARWFIRDTRVWLDSLEGELSEASALRAVGVE